MVDIYDGLNESLKAVDSVLYTEVRADIEKDLNSESNRAYQKSSKDVLGGPLDQVGLLMRIVIENILSTTNSFENNLIFAFNASASDKYLLETT